MPTSGGPRLTRRLAEHIGAKIVSGDFPAGGQLNGDADFGGNLLVAVEPLSDMALLFTDLRGQLSLAADLSDRVFQGVDAHGGAFNTNWYRPVNTLRYVIC